MQCPTCHEVMTSDSHYGQTLDRCVSCGGLWVDHSELGSVVRNIQPSQGPVEPIACGDDILCPKCDELLAPFNYAHDSGVFIHRCNSCGGAWLESGQLELIARYRSGSLAIQELGNAFGDVLRASNRLRFARQLLRSRLLSGMVAASYLLFALLASGSLLSVPWLLLSLMLPMACIWFPMRWAVSMGFPPGSLGPRSLKPRLATSWPSAAGSY